MLSRKLLQEIADTCNKPTHVPLLDRVFDDYNRAKALQQDEPGYYRLLYHLARAVPGLTMVELGTMFGGASLHFVSGGGASHAIDCGDNINRAWFAPLHASRFTFTLARSTSPEALEVGRRVKPNIVLIDTDHTYNTTVEEFNLWRPLLAPGGIILFDDVHAYSALNRKDFGCGKFWQELQGRKMELPQLHEGGWGFGIWLGD